MEKLNSLNQYNLKILKITVMMLAITLLSFFTEDKFLLTSISILQIISGIFIWFLIKKSEDSRLTEN